MLVYVAGKYSADTAEQRMENIKAAGKVAAELWDQGFGVICPHTNTGEFLVPTSSCTYDMVMKGDMDMMSRCDAVVMLPGWEQSKGSTMEITYAQELGMPIYFYPQLPEHHPTEIHRPEQSRHFLNTVMQMYRVHLAKNNDYSPANILATGQIGLATRLWDKVARLLNLTGFHIEISSSSFSAPITPKNESIDDTLMDAAVYSVIGLLLRKGVWGK
jgi:nucleoside 2-deoxyribosyltransferase